MKNQEASEPDYLTVVEHESTVKEAVTQPSRELDDDNRSRERSIAQKGKPKRKLRVLIVTPEITALPDCLATPSLRKVVAKGGGLADMAASLVEGLDQRNVEVHVALPHYRRLFGVEFSTFKAEELKNYRRKIGNTRVHLAEDRSFYYRDQVYSYRHDENPDLSLAFQREVINHIIPDVEPDVIHCHDWMTGLIPAAARRIGIPCLFTLHNIHTERISMAHMEHLGMDTPDFWQSLYCEHYPENYEESRNTNRVDLLASGILASDYVNTVSPTFLNEIIQGCQGELPVAIREHLNEMREGRSACGILNAPHPSYNPEVDPALVQNFEPMTATEGKRANKIVFQKKVGLAVNSNAPLYFWPSRLDPMQKGCQLLTHILHQLVADHADIGLQLAVVADGPFQEHFQEIVNRFGLHSQIAICHFDEDLSRLGYAASDFTLMPSLFEPCGLAQMVAMLYGSLPVVHSTGGLKDSVSHLPPAGGDGNGFVFETFDSEGLRWAIEQSINYFRCDTNWRTKETTRIMTESRKKFRSDRMVEDYLDIYRHITAKKIA